MAGYAFSFDLPVRNEWANVDRVRTSVQSFFTAMFQEVDGCHAIAMVTGELLENAVKYGAWDGANRTFRLRVWGDGPSAHVSVESPALGGDPNVTELLRTIEWIRSFGSAEEAYQAKLLQIAAPDPTTSRLGLVRIAYEGGCTLAAAIEDDRVRVTADLSL